MLIVVAIIAILIAVSIPTVNSALEKSRVSTDAANERAAKAAATVEFLTNGTTGKYGYDAVSGVLTAGNGTTAIAPSTTYGKCTTTNAGIGSHSHSKGYIIVEIAADGAVTVSWSTGTALDSTDMIANG
jgi:type IV pilus assembly protein PilA